MQNTPKSLRLQIGIFGRRNAGKSSLLNALTGQGAAIVSATPGATADPVEKAMEMIPLGPVLLIDTAGLDDNASDLGERRSEKSRAIFARADLALLVAEPGKWSAFEDKLLAGFQASHTPVIAVFNKSDLGAPEPELLQQLAARKIDAVSISARDGTGIDALRSAILRHAPEDFMNAPGMLDGLAAPGRSVLLIIPIDKEAPRGRLVLPQVQAIRNALDHDAWCVIVKENALETALNSLNPPPALAVTDSQAFGSVAKLIPDSIPLTSFSILLARLKGDLAVCAAGAAAIPKLNNNSTVLIAEACAHPPIGEDIGTVKIPRLLHARNLPNLNFKFVRGHDFPANLDTVDLVIHCGACMFNRREALSRILLCTRRGIPFTNYGVAIAYCHGILERALRPFPEALAAYQRIVGTP